MVTRRSRQEHLLSKSQAGCEDEEKVGSQLEQGGSSEDVIGRLLLGAAVDGTHQEAHQYRKCGYRTPIFSSIVMRGDLPKPLATWGIPVHSPTGTSGGPISARKGYKHKFSDNL